MDYSNSAGVKIMAPIAADNKCTFIAFDQTVVITAVEARLGKLGQGHGGICHGLSVAWLESMKTKDTQSAAYLNDVADFEKSPLFYRAYMGYRHQEAYRGASTSGSYVRKTIAPEGTPPPQNGPRFDQSGKHTARFFGNTAHSQNGVITHTGAADKKFASNQMSQFVILLTSTYGTRYYMLGVPGHMMAAVGNKFGNCYFFDPNCGVVSSSSSNNLARCLQEYFYDETVRKAYGNNQQSNWLTVSTFKGI